MTMPRPKLVLLLLHAAAAKIRGVQVLAVGTKPSLGGPLQTPAAAEHSVSEAYSRRQAARSRPYSEGRSRVPRRDEEAGTLQG